MALNIVLAVCALLCIVAIYLDLRKGEDQNDDKG